MSNLAVVGSRKVNGVAELHSKLVKQNLFPDFVEFYGQSKFGNVTNGSGCSLHVILQTKSLIEPFLVTPRRWLDQVLLQSPPFLSVLSDYGLIHAVQPVSVCSHHGGPEA